MKKKIQPRSKLRQPNHQLYASEMHLIKVDYDKEMKQYKAKKKELEAEHECALADIEARREQAMQHYLFPAGMFEFNL